MPLRHEHLTQIDSRTYAFMHLPGGWGQTNTGLVVGDDSALVVDTVWDRPRAQANIEAWASVCDVPITEAVNTHSDGDHWWGNNTLPASARITTSDAALTAMREDTPPAAVGAFAAIGRLARPIPGAAGHLGGYMHQVTGGADLPRRLPRLPDHTFSVTEDIEFGGRSAHLRNFGPAHTPGDLIVHVSDSGVVFTGDLLFIGCTPVIWHGPLDNWTRAIDYLLQLDATTYVPGHGPICGTTEIKLLRDYWTWLADAGRDQHRAGVSVAAAARALVRSPDFAPFAQWGQPERIVLNLSTLFRLLDGGEPAPPSITRRAKAFADAGRLQHDLRP